MACSASPPQEAHTKKFSMYINFFKTLWSRLNCSLCHSKLALLNFYTFLKLEINFYICYPQKAYNLDFSLPMSFSSLRALPMSPEIFILPVMKAVAGFREPENILKKLLASMTKVASGVAGLSPFPHAPLPFLRSMNHFPASSPVTSKAYTALVFSTRSAFRKPSIWVNTCNTRNVQYEKTKRAGNVHWWFPRMFYGQPFLEATKKWLLCFVCMQEITQVEKLCNCFRTSKEKWNKFMPKKYCLKSSKYTQSGWVKKCRDWTLYIPEKLATVFSQSKSLIRSSWCKLESCRNKLIKKRETLLQRPWAIPEPPDLLPALVCLTQRTWVWLPASVPAPLLLHQTHPGRSQASAGSLERYDGSVIDSIFQEIMH